MAQRDERGKREYISFMARIIKEESTLKGIMKGLHMETSILEKIWKIELFAGGVLILAGAAAWFFGYAWHFVVPGILLVFLGASHALKKGDNRADLGRFKGGAAGEQEVTKIMQTGLPDSYMILNDCSVRSGSRSAQNDHIVLGPNGIFVVETKAYAGVLQGRAGDDYLQQTKTRGGKSTQYRIKNPIPQNAYHIEIVAARMSEGGFVTDDIHSIIVFTNRWARIEIDGSDVPVLKPEEIASTILNTKSKFSYSESWQRKLASHLDPAVKFE